eukprot:5240749-Pleurochrysis_carterae.AAC.1
MVGVEDLHGRGANERGAGPQGPDPGSIAGSCEAGKAGSQACQGARLGLAHLDVSGKSVTISSNRAVLVRLRDYQMLLRKGGLWRPSRSSREE